MQRKEKLKQNFKMQIKKTPYGKMLCVVLILALFCILFYEGISTYTFSIGCSSFIIYKSTLDR